MKTLRKNNEGKSTGKGDILFLVSVILLAAYGLVCVYSASRYNAEVQYGDEFFFFRKQVIGFVLGLAAMAAIAFIDYRKLKKWGIPALALSLVLLALVFVPGVGKAITALPVGSGSARLPFSLRRLQSTRSCCLRRRTRRKTQRACAPFAVFCPYSARAAEFACLLC